jgi:hypothetical protein
MGSPDVHDEDEEMIQTPSAAEDCSWQTAVGAEPDMR